MFKRKESMYKRKEQSMFKRKESMNKRKESLCISGKSNSSINGKGRSETGILSLCILGKKMSPVMTQ